MIVLQAGFELSPTGPEVFVKYVGCKKSGGVYYPPAVGYGS